ncbi:MAG: hypothetical protein AAB472_03265, partial [Patescibacteria group bacterium]
TYTGLSTTSQPSSSQLLVSNGGAGVYGVSTTTPTFGLGLSGSNFVTLSNGGAASLSISTTTLYSGSANQIPYFTGTNTLGATSTLTVNVGGTGSTTPLGGILVGNGSGPINSLVIGSNLSFDGTTLSATGGGGSFPFTSDLYNGTLVNSTSTALWLKGTSPFSLIASSTFATYASSSQLTNSGNTYLTSLAAGSLYLGSGSLVNSVATSSLAVSGPFTTAGTLGALLGGTNSTITYTGLATTSQPSSSQLLVSNGGAGVYGVATSTATINNGLTGTLTTLGTSQTIGLANIAANSVLANNTSSAGTPSAIATSTLYGTGVGGHVLQWSNTTGGLVLAATSTCIQITGSAALCDGDDATSAGAGVSTIQESDSTVDGAATTIDFLSGFDITSSPAGEANVALDLTEYNGAASTTLFSNFRTAYFGGTATSTFDSAGVLTLASSIVTGATTISGAELALLDAKTGTLIDDTDLTSGDGAGNTSTGSGLEAGTGGIGLLQGCANNEVLKWNEASSVWACGSSSYSKFTSAAYTNVLNDTGNTADQASADVDVTSQTAADATEVLLGYDLVFTAQTTGDAWQAHVMPNGTAQSADNIIGMIEDNDQTAAPFLDDGGVVIVDLDANQIFDYSIDELVDGGTVTFRLGVLGYWSPVTTGADLAEYYYASEPLQPGDVVSLDPSYPAGIKKSSGAYDEHVLGVVSTAPGMVLGDVPTPTGGVRKLTDEEAGNLVERTPYPLALAGRIPVNVSTENGPIEAGDYLTPSSVPGVAMKATKAGRVIGQALFGHDKVEIGAVMMFVNNTFSNGSRSVLTITEGTDGTVVPVTMDARRLLERLMNDASVIAESDISEIFTDRVVAGLEVITPRVVADTVETNRLISVNEDGKIYIGGTATSTDTGSPIVFDSAGNAFFAGTLTAANIEAQSIKGLEITAGRFTQLEEVFTGLASTSVSMLGSLEESITTNSLSVSGDVSIGGVASTSELRALKVIAGEIDSPLLALLVASTTDLSSRMLALESAPTFGELLNAPEGLSMGGMLTMQGALTVDRIGSNTEVLSFMNDVEFFGHPYFTTDTAGFALVKKGAREVHVAFAKEYLEKPIINITQVAQTGEGDTQSAAAIQALFDTHTRFLVAHASTSGFTIVLDKPAEQDTTFNWMAIAVKGARTVESEEVGQSDIEPLPPEVTQDTSEAAPPLPPESVPEPRPVEPTIPTAIEEPSIGPVVAETPPAPSTETTIGPDPAPPAPEPTPEPVSTPEPAPESVADTAP